MIPPKRGRDQLDGADDLLGVLRVEADRERVDAGELLEQAALALHHRHRRARADVAEPEHRGAVGDDGDGVALDRVLEGAILVVGDRQAHAGDARGVGHREIVARLQRVLVVLLDLAADVHQERAVDRVDHARALHRADRGDDLLPVVLAGGVDDDVADRVPGVDLDRVDGHDDPTGVADRAGQVRERARGLVELDADRQAELRAGGDAAHGDGLPGRRRRGLAERHLIYLPSVARAPTNKVIGVTDLQPRAGASRA